jgi:integrase
MCGPLSGHGQTALLPRRGIGRWPSAAPLFVGAEGERITRGALVHGLRHTFATELANADVNVYTLMKLRVECNSAQFRPYPSAPIAATQISQSDAVGPRTT